MLEISDQMFAAAAEKLPSTPRIFGRVNVALRNPDVGVDEIARILKLDAALSARLLRQGNSAAAAAPASDLAEAIQRIGFREVFRVVGLAMTAQLYVSGLPMYGVGGTELWENSVACAFAMERLAAQLEVDGRAVDGRSAYTLGLLRSVGRLVLQRLAAGQVCAPLAGRKETAELVLAWEAQTFGMNSAEASARLLTLWNFSPAVARPLVHHFQPEKDPEKEPLTALLHIAGHIAETLGHGLGIEKQAWTLGPDVLAQAGVTPEFVTQVAAETAEAVAEQQRLAE